MMTKNLICYKIFILAVLLYLPLSGSDCNNTTTQVTNENIQGSWTLVQNTGGSQHDICPGETADFQTNGVAVLTCPNQQPINRSYTVTNSVLKFTETQVEYNVNLTNNSNTLNMTGIGNISGRVLVYNRVTSGNEIKTAPSVSTRTKNSSER